MSALANRNGFYLVVKTSHVTLQGMARRPIPPYGKTGSADEVLIVEDEPLFAFDIKHNIETSRRVVSGLRVKRSRAWLQLKNQVDLVFLDINVRDGATYDLARELRTA